MDDYYALCNTLFIDLPSYLKVPPSIEDVQKLTLAYGMNKRHFEPWFECEIQ